MSKPICPFLISWKYLLTKVRRNSSFTRGIVLISRSYLLSDSGVSIQCRNISNGFSCAPLRLLSFNSLSNTASTILNIFKLLKSNLSCSTHAKACREISGE